MSDVTPPGANAVATLLARAADPADATALRYHDTTVSYHELATRTARAGAGLQRLGVQPEQRVLFLMTDSPAMVAASASAVAKNTLVSRAMS